jgi:putative SOS response-associated peptidase YedK
MCGRYVIVSDVVTIEKRFNIPLKFDGKIEPNFNAGVGQMLPVIANDEPNRIKLFRFGFTPNWATDRRITINARVDTSNDNPNNEMDYFSRGGKAGIYLAKYWRSSIRSKRCIIIADAFYEGSKEEKLSKPFLVHMRNKKRPFAMAGVYDEFEDNDGSIKQGFAILTVPANEVLAAIGHHRSPVIIPNSAIQNYLNSDLSGITEYLKPYDANLMNAYPVSPTMKNQRLNSKSLIEPIGQRVIKEYDELFMEGLKLEGMGDKKRSRKSGSHWGDTPDWAKPK